MITSNIAFYPCIDLAETEDFYRRIIGLDTVFSNQTSRIFSANRGHFGFVQYPDRQAAQGRLCLSLNCRSEAEVDAEYHRVVAAGGQPEGQPARHANHPVYSFFVKDPNGYLVEFQKLADLDI